MYDAILVGIDDSEQAERALEHALSLAETTDATVHVVTVVESAGSPMRFGIAEVDDLNEAAESLVDEVVDAYDGQDVDIRGDVRRGKPAEALTEYAADADADLLVVGQRGADGVTGAILGSTADRLARTAAVPVTIVPAN
ncbi:UspA domain-containing protein [Halovivax asiaticus JCM 14624]|uniref:UspA domain-containing protein n=1 Tax=Halovivax asiaticus JCM 14624 TaxID=1227490 RepID=M0BF28_9EURY|nr:universal stress protein [Halovivax asiaticus]ELZ08908.1 UspA domain-containing protein [Halovivax asiaticus JCM 14624]